MTGPISDQARTGVVALSHRRSCDQNARQLETINDRAECCHLFFYVVLYLFI